MSWCGGGEIKPTPAMEGRSRAMVASGLRPPQLPDGIDVVVRRRRNQAHTRDGVTHPRDGLIDLVAGQLAALARLGALRHLDLDLDGVDEEIDGHARTSAG